METVKLVSINNQTGDVTLLFTFADGTTSTQVLAGVPLHDKKEFLQHTSDVKSKEG